MIADDPPASRLVTPSLGLAAVVLAVWAWLIVQGPVDWDLGWQLHLANQILDGYRLYIDVGATEQHPPLYTWMCTFVTWVARLLHLDPVRSFLVTVSIACAACAFLAIRIARGPAIVLLGFGSAALAAYGLAGGSGEQMSSAFALPYIAAAAALLQGREQGRAQEKRWGIAIGLVAGLGMALKPHYALVWLLVEAAIAWHRRSWRSFLRPTSVAVFSVWIAYIAATLLFTPSYFQAALNAARYYGAFMKVTVGQVLDTSPYEFLLLVWLLYFLGRRWTDQAVLGRLLLLAATAMWLGGMIQMKGWYHHWTPAIGLTMAALAALWPARLRLAGSVIVVAAASWHLVFAQDHMRKGQISGPTFLPAMMSLVNDQAKDGSILVLSDGLAIGFPLVNFTGVNWTLPESSLWMVPGLYSESWGTNKPFDYREPHEWPPFERQVHELIWTGVQRHPPDLILIPGPVGPAGFDFRAFIQTDPRMREFMQGWVPSFRVGPYEVWTKGRRSLD